MTLKAKKVNIKQNTMKKSNKPKDSDKNLQGK